MSESTRPIILSGKEVYALLAPDTARSMLYNGEHTVSVDERFTKRFEAIEIAEIILMPTSDGGVEVVMYLNWNDWAKIKVAQAKIEARAYLCRL